MECLGKCDSWPRIGILAQRGVSQPDFSPQTHNPRALRCHQNTKHLEVDELLVVLDQLDPIKNTEGQKEVNGGCRAKQSGVWWRLVESRMNHLPTEDGYPAHNGCHGRTRAISSDRPPMAQLLAARLW